MLCDKCQKAAAAVHLTQVVDGEVKKIHLCAACAAKSGIDLQKTISVTDVLMGMDQALTPDADAAEREADGVCPSCGISRREYKRRGRLGCAVCYETFSDDLIPMVRAVHHHLRHTGKAPRTHALRAAVAEDPGSLRSALEKAVEAEDYEAAARLRDQLSQVERCERDRHES